jgi:hypothetical protein
MATVKMLSFDYKSPVTEFSRRVEKHSSISVKR